MPKYFLVQTATGSHVRKELPALEDDSPVNEDADAPKDGDSSDNTPRNNYEDAPEDRDNGNDYNPTDILGLGAISGGGCGIVCPPITKGGSSQSASIHSLLTG